MAGSVSQNGLLTLDLIFLQGPTIAGEEPPHPAAELILCTIHIHTAFYYTYSRCYYYETKGRIRN